MTILDTRWMRLEQKAAPVGVDQRVTLTPLDLLPGVVALWAAGFGLASRPVRSRSAITSA